MSFGRDLDILFGSSKYRGMNKPLKAVTLSDDQETLTFEFLDGTMACFHVEGDCCSRSWIEHLDVPYDIEGATITAIDDDGVETPDDVDLSQYEVLKVYQTKFRTPKGDIILEYRNDSNGYYGGYLERES